jgi:hypothetical protein
VMIEAVENHMPEVIVIDEIGTELEALAARTIAERGVQLIGTAHGNRLENLLRNPTLSDLVGGIQAVTLGDEEAQRRGTQKTVLERKAPPTFDVLVEIVDVGAVIVYADVMAAVDGLLRGEEVAVEQRALDVDGQLHRAQALVGPQEQATRQRTHGLDLDWLKRDGSGREQHAQGAGEEWRTSYSRGGKRGGTKARRGTGRFRRAA